MAAKLRRGRRRGWALRLGAGNQRLCGLLIFAMERLPRIARRLAGGGDMGRPPRQARVIR